MDGGVISGTNAASAVLEVAMLLREVGLVRPTEPAPSAIDIVPLFETIDDLHRCHHVLAALTELVKAGKIDATAPKQAIETYGIDPERPAPWRV